jgi:hypothetical protein
MGADCGGAVWPGCTGGFPELSCCVSWALAVAAVKRNIMATTATICAADFFKAVKAGIILGISLRTN